MKRTNRDLLACLILAGLLFWLLWRYARLPLTVALIAWGVGAVIAPMARACSARLGISRRACGAFFFVVIVALAVAVLAWSARRLYGEFTRLTAWLIEHRELLAEGSGRIVLWLSRLFSLDEDREWQLALQASLGQWICRGALWLGRLVSVGIGRALVATPRLLIGIILTVVACVYTSMDYDRLCEAIVKGLPTPWRDRAASIGGACREALGATARAYCILTMLIFAELLLVLSLCGVRYAFLLSLLIAAVDLLPILGAGTVLIPWSVASFLFGRRLLGTVLLALYVAIVLTRQLALSHLLGKKTGLHPLVALLAMLTGFSLLGVLGILLFPMLATVLRVLWEMPKNSLPPSFSDTAREKDRTDP